MNQSQALKLASSREFEFILKNIHDDMLVQEQNGNYVEADHLRQKALREKKRWQQMAMQQMGNRHAQEVNFLENQLRNDLDRCNADWTLRIDNYVEACRQQIADSDKKNKKECDELRKSLNQQLPTKVKESYELLNLREMERHMAKQKDFTQAHLIQQRIKQLYENELKAWNEGRNSKIEQAIANLKARQASDRELFNKRNQIHLEDENNRWREEKVSLHQRFQNSLKELKGKQEREMLSFSRSFKTKGGIFSDKFDQKLDD